MICCYSLNKYRLNNCGNVILNNLGYYSIYNRIYYRINDCYIDFLKY